MSFVSRGFRGRRREDADETDWVSLHHSWSTAWPARHHELFGTGFGDRLGVPRGRSGSVRERLGREDQVA